VTFLIAMFIFEMQFIWLYLDELMGKGLEPWIILQLLVYASARIVNMALPLAVLMSSIMTFGALAENNELTAMKSAGMSLSRILRPLVIFMFVLGIGSFVFANNVWPIANLKFRTLLFSIAQQRPALNLEPGVFFNGIEGVSMRVADKDNNTGKLKDVLIYDHRNPNGGNRTVIRAAEGEMTQTEDKRFLILTLRNGNTYDEKEEKHKPNSAPLTAVRPERTFPQVHGSFETMILRLDLSNLIFKNNDEDIFKNSFEMMTVNQLATAIDSLETAKDSVVKVLANLQANPPAQADKSISIDQPFKKLPSPTQLQEEIKGREQFINRNKIEFHRKFTLAISVIILFFIGAPLGALIKRGGVGWPTIIALGIFIVFEMLTIAGEKMTKSEIVSAFTGMWLATFVTFPLGLFITIRARFEGHIPFKSWFKRKSKPAQ